MIFKDLSAWSLDVLSLYSITLLIVHTAAAPALYVVGQFYPWSLCSSLKDIDSYWRFSHLFHLIGEIYKSRKGYIPCPDLRALIKTLWVSRIFSHSRFSHFFELLRWHLNNTLLYRGTTLKREYISTEFNCRRISVIVYPANRGYIF